MLNAIYDAKQELHIVNDKSLEELFNIIKKDIPGCEIIKLNNLIKKKVCLFIKITILIM